MSSKNTESKKDETVSTTTTEPKKSAPPAKPQELGLEALNLGSITPVFSAGPLVDDSENVCQRAVKAITNGVITQWKPIVDESTGELLKDPDTGRKKQEPVDPKQATVWQTSYQDRGNIPADIQFPDNQGAERFEEMCKQHNRVILYQIHNPILDAEGNPMTLPSDKNKVQHGNYMLVIILPPAYQVTDASGRMVPDPAGSPRDQFLRDFQTKLPEFKKYNSIGTGELVVKYLINNTPNDKDFMPNENVQTERENGTFPKSGLYKVQDLMSRLTIPSLPGDRKLAQVEDMIFLRANSGFDQLYINRQTRQPRMARGTRTTKLPESKTVGNKPDPLSVIES